MRAAEKNKEILKKIASSAGRNYLSLPRIIKVVLNVGTGDFKDNREAEAKIAEELSQISGQRPRGTRAKASISGFKTRKGENIGFSVTLRGKRMWDFLDRLINVVLPRIRDFEGIRSKSFDSSNNFTIGLREQMIFPEIDPNDIRVGWGMSVTVVLRNARDKKLVDEYLKGLGFVLE